MLSIKRIVPLLLFTLLFAISVREIMDPDFWWHLRTGQYIVQGHLVPHVDIFSSTNSGRPWVAHEWLSDVLIYALYRASGLAGLILFFSAVVTGAFAVTYLRCAGKPFNATAAVALAALASFANWGVRPQMLTLLLASVFLWILEDHASSGSARVWLLVPMTALWVNLHAAFLLGPALVLFFAAAAAMDAIWENGWAEETRNKAVTLLCVFAACLAVVPLNPNGIRMYAYPFSTLGSTALRSYVREWQSPDFHNSTFLPLAFLLLITLAVLARSAKRVRPSSLLLFMATAYLALQSVRHIPLFAIVAAPLLAEHLPETALFTRFLGNEGIQRPGLTAARLVLMTAVFVVCGWRVSRVIANEAAWERIEFPVSAAEFILSHRPPGPIYNPYEWGGYLIWRLYPEYGVYIDGRNDTYGDTFVSEYFQAARGHTNVLKQLDHYAIRTAVTDPQTPLATLLRNDPHWTAVFQDDQAVVFTRK